MYEWYKLLKVLGSPFSEQVNIKIDFSEKNYKFSLENKVVLTFLSKISDKRTERFYKYHSSRLNAIFETLKNVGEIFEKKELEYVIFKTIRPFREEVADIDVLFFHERDSYIAARILEKYGYISMEKSYYCTTLYNPKHNFITEIMIDNYREISVGPLIYLDKKLLSSYKETKAFYGSKIKIFKPEAELLTIIAHSIFKEKKFILAEYLTALWLLRYMDEDSIINFRNLVKKSKMVLGVRVFFSLVSYLHIIAYGFIPSKIKRILSDFGGPVDISDCIVGRNPPFGYNIKILARIYLEKLNDPVFRYSWSNVFQWLKFEKNRERLVNAIFKI